jgi:hypothetical protein
MRDASPDHAPPGHQRRGRRLSLINLLVPSAKLGVVSTLAAGGERHGAVDTTPAPPCLANAADRHMAASHSPATWACLAWV